MNQEKNNIDSFLDGLTTEGNKKIYYEKVYERPGKTKSIIGFVVSSIILFILIGLFTFSVMYFTLLIVNILVLVFFGINAFTEKGFGLPKTIAYTIDEDEEVEDNDDKEQGNYDDLSEDDWYLQNK